MPRNVESFKIIRTIKAPRYFVWRSFTTAEHFAAWFGPKDFTNPVCEIDFQKDGKIHFEMRSPDGTLYPVNGIYKEITEPERLVLIDSQFDGEGRRLFNGQTEFLFSGDGGVTELLIHMSIFEISEIGVPYLSGMQEGWNQILDKLEQFSIRLHEQDIKSREMYIERIFNAPRELVFAMWTDPRLIINWWGQDDYRITLKSMDAVAGGVWDFVMHAPDGTDHPNRIVYHQIIVPEFLAYTHSSAESENRGQFDTTIRFFELEPEKTRLTMYVLFKFADASNADIVMNGALEGMHQSFARLGDVLEEAVLPVVVEKVYNAPVRKVWQALTDKEQMKEWYFTLEEFIPKAGFTFQFEAGDEVKKYLHECTVTEVIPEKKLAYTWKYPGYNGISLVTFSLADEGETTRLTLTHSGLHTFPLSNKEFAKGNFAEGWQHLLSKALTDFLNSKV
ncbi:MAG: SRPBCC domain-containing protein [Ignavibacteriales bacterium]|nr:SRPBCC domain-containing protein [Ignavibacteriales bacterium]